MKKQILLLLVCISSLANAQQTYFPCNKGDSAFAYNRSRKLDYSFKIERNDPFAMCKSKLFFNPNFFFSKYTIFSLGFSGYTRLGLYGEYRYGINYIFGGLSDTTRNGAIQNINYNKSLYQADFKYTYYFKEQNKKYKSEARERWKKHDYDYRTGDTCLVKRIRQYGISFGLQSTVGNFYASSNQLIKSVQYNGEEIYKNKVTLPYKSLVVAFGPEIRYSANQDYSVGDKSNFFGHAYVINLYAKLLAAPILSSQYLTADMQIKNRFPNFSDHVGFTVGAFMECTGTPLNATLEGGIMPGMGAYVRGVWIFNFSLHHSKLNINGTKATSSWI